jgi:hypothetical protein
VASSSVKPSSTNCTTSRDGFWRAACMGCRGGRGTGCSDGAKEEDVVSEDELSSSADAVSAGAASDDTPFSAPPDAALRFPLRRFLFLRPRSV